MDGTELLCNAGRKKNSNTSSFVSLKPDMEKVLQRKNSMKASSVWLFLMKTSATKDIPYNRHASTHKMFLELALIPLAAFPITIIYNFPAVVIFAPSLPGLASCFLRSTSL